MRTKTSVGIDIGTYQVKVVVAETRSDKHSLPKIIGIGYAESKGLRHGYIINQTDAIRSIRKAIRQAEKASGIKIDKAFVSIGGIGLSNYTSTGHIMISRADAEITELDIEKVADECKRQIPNSVSINTQIIHTIPIEYKIDGKTVLGNPVGLKGNKLEAKILYVNCLSHHVNELISAVENSNIEIIDAVAAPLAAGIVNLSKTDRVAGCVLANIGSETVSIVVYEEDNPISLEVFKVGSNDITNDIALGMQISLSEAEKIKQGGSIEIEEKNSKKTSENKLKNIISARLSDVFELIDAHLKKINRSGLLPAGIIITGGGSGITTAEDLAKATLNLPSRIAKIASNKEGSLGDPDSGLRIKDSTWSVAYGLCVFGLSVDSENSIGLGFKRNIFKNIFNRVVDLFRRFLP